MDTDSYIENIDSLTEQILSKNPKAKFVFISPWLALESDPYTPLSMEERDLMLAEYAEGLKTYCEKKGCCFINPNPALYETLIRYAPSQYLIDHIHPNAGAGIALYSETVISESIANGI
jgi:lysophospholipase L1-like esterase